MSALIAFGVGSVVMVVVGLVGAAKERSIQRCGLGGHDYEGGQ